VPYRIGYFYLYTYGRNSMRKFGIAVLVTAALTLAVSAAAGPPVNGVYQSTDIDPSGTLELGRYTEAFAAAGGGLVSGVTYNARSWDDSDLGLQWAYYCGTMVSPPVTLVDNVNANGDGNRTYLKTFVGGIVWLSGSGPWANGDADYPGIVDSYTMFETVTYSNWNRVAAIFNIDATGHFDNYAASCLTFAIGNGSQAGSTDWGDPLDPDYPELLQQGTCSPVMTLGTWWNMHTITLTIKGCTIPVEETTWGAVKSMYSE
jgi:hypothetical protein